MRIEIPTSGVPIPRKRKWKCVDDFSITSCVVGICEDCGAEYYALWKNYDLEVHSFYLADPFFRTYCHANRITDSNNDSVINDYKECVNWANKTTWAHKDEMHVMFPRTDSTTNSRTKTYTPCPVTCPCCGNALTVYREYAIKRRENTEEKLNEFFHSINAIIRNNDSARALIKVGDLETVYGKETPTQRFSNTAIQAIKKSPEKLQAFLQELISIEANIYEISERLSYLFTLLPRLQRAKIQYIYESKDAEQKELSLLESEITGCEKELLTIDTLTPSYFSISEPVMPSPPDKPSFKEPGLFNKKKVLAENARLQEEYNLSLQHFDEAMAAYEAECKALNDALEIKREQLRLEKTQRLKSAQKKLTQLNAEPKNISGESSPITKKEAALLSEIEDVKRLLQNLIHARTAYYNSNIVFKKYCDIVALSTFYEYLVSGRCSSLEGAHGAYNIYEQEIRADKIISQLDDALSLLESIKDNQYMLYSVMSDANSNLCELNTKTDNMLGAIEKIGDHVESIEYNSAVTAYYAKKNAELTDALGLMVALK